MDGFSLLGVGDTKTLIECDRQTTWVQHSESRLLGESGISYFKIELVLQFILIRRLEYDAV